MERLTQDILKAVDGYEGLYSVSRDGQVWSHRKKRFFSAGDNGKGYKFVHLVKDRQPSRFYVHRLVASAFIDGECEGKIVNHIDGKKSNNVADNLEWVTPSENMKHAWKHGMCLAWDKQVAAVKEYNKTKRALTDDQVRQIKVMHSNGRSQHSLARQFSVGVGTISTLLKGKSYKEVA